MMENVIEKMKQWLMTCPLWEGALFVDHHAGRPGSAGLYPVGVEQVERREDVLGNVTAVYRCILNCCGSPRVSRTTPKTPPGCWNFKTGCISSAVRV